MEGQHGRQLALRPRLHSALAGLRDDVLVVPLELRRRPPQRCAVQLPPAGEPRVPRRSPHRHASLWVLAVPHYPARPRLHRSLPQDHGGYVRHVDLAPPCARL
eukprot:3133528-Pleurochrysis_carterae.AAC.1